MKALQRIGQFLLARAQESATWRGLTLIVTAFGVNIAPEKQEAIITAGLLIAGLLGAAFPDKLTRREPTDQ